MSERARAGSVLVAGAINTDLVTRTAAAPSAGETVTGQSFAIYGGGKGANQGVAVARSGVATVMLGAVGRDAFGEQRLAALRADRIVTDWIEVAEDVASGVALIIVDDSGENRIVYVPGATLTVGPDAARRAVRAAHPSSVLATLELPIPTLRVLFEEAVTIGARVVLNAAPGPRAGAELLPHVDVLIANEVEARQLSGTADTVSDWQAIGLQLIGMGPRAVILTLGAAGAVVIDGGELTHLAPPPVTVVDTTGAGDAFCGAFAAAVARGESMSDAARRGVVAGSLATTKAGAQPSIPTDEEIMRLMHLDQ